MDSITNSSSLSAEARPASTTTDQNDCPNQPDSSVPLTQESSLPVNQSVDVNNPESSLPGGISTAHSNDVAASSGRGHPNGDQVVRATSPSRAARMIRLQNETENSTLPLQTVFRRRRLPREPSKHTILSTRQRLALSRGIPPHPRRSNTGTQDQRVARGRQEVPNPEAPDFARSREDYEAALILMSMRGARW